jgi:glycerol-3-phosphate O-acyltransferase/dihydroxyacetone phosphate acyltransferase
MDIATLSPLSACAQTIDALTREPAATVPHRRQISFWTKANSFKNPILRFILVSSGAIPVQRNPNNVRDASISGTDTVVARG